MTRRTVSIWMSAATMAVATAMVPAAFAQDTGAKVVVEIQGVPNGTGKDPHPVVYHWEGENKPIYNPVKHYTFFYTGTVSPDATVPAGENIQRVAIPNDEWEFNKQAIISRLRSFFEEAYNLAAQAQKDKPKVTFDEDFHYVDVPQDNSNPGALDPRAAAEWSFYYDQFVLWQFYCKRVLLNDRDADSANTERESLEDEETRKALENQEDLKGANVDDVMKAMKEMKQAEKASGSGQPGTGTAGKAAFSMTGAPVSNTTGGGGRGGARGGGGRGASKTPPVATAKDAKVATDFDPEADYGDVHHNDLFRQEFIRMAEKREREATKTFTDMLGRIESRASQMQRLQDWLKDKKVQLHDFASGWEKVKQGESFFQDDIFYLISKERIEEMPPDSLNVIVRDVVTPQDLIGRDGKIKKPVVE